jgi:hypothetical protein
MSIVQFVKNIYYAISFPKYSILAIRTCKICVYLYSENTCYKQFSFIIFKFYAIKNPLISFFSLILEDNLKINDTGTD